MLVIKRVFAGIHTRTGKTNSERFPLGGLKRELPGTRKRGAGGICGYEATKICDNASGTSAPSTQEELIVHNFGKKGKCPKSKDGKHHKSKKSKKDARVVTSSA